MKKIINKNYKLIIAFILGMIVSGCGVLAATTYAIDSKMVSYTDNSGLVQLMFKMLLIRLVRI